MVDAETGLPANSNTKKIIYESFKHEDNFVASFEKSCNKDKMGYYDSENQRTILRVY